MHGEINSGAADMAQYRDGRFIRRAEVEHLVGLSRSRLYEMISAGLFPRPLYLGAKTPVWCTLAVGKWMGEVRKRAEEEGAVGNVHSWRAKEFGQTLGNARRIGRRRPGKNQD